MSHNFIVSLKVLKLMKLVSLLSSNLVFDLVSYSVSQRSSNTPMHLSLQSKLSNGPQLLLSLAAVASLVQ